VDDKPAVLLTYRLILQQQGYEVTAVETYGCAIDELDAGEFDLLLCDLGLGGTRNGFDVIEHARVRRPAIRSVLLTGYSGADIALKAADMGISVLFKPVDVRELLAVVQTPLSTERAIA